MKQIVVPTVIALASVSLFAGEPAPYVEAAPMSPPPQPTLLNWFAGGSVGYLFDGEEELYTGHLGFDLPNQAFGATQSIFLEIGYTELEESEQETVFSNSDVRATASGEVASSGAAPIPVTRTAKLEIIPITLNYKLESPLSQQVSGYFGVGAGIALLDFKANDGFQSFSDDDTTFFAQVFTGLIYNVSEAFEIFGGARWIFIDDSDFSDNGTSFEVDSEDDVVGELGFRFNF